MLGRESAGLGTGTGRTFGAGWISGVLAITAGALACGGVLCLLFPSWLVTPEARPHYPLGLVRALIHALLVVALGLGTLSVLLRRRKTLGLTAIALAVAATLLGGAGVEVGRAADGTPGIGLDWFLVNLVVLALVFVPLERLFPHRPQQPIFRRGWTTDLAYFAASHLLVQVTVLLTMLPAVVLFAWAVHPAVQRAVAAQPLALQWVEIVLVADLAQYAVHRAFHRVPVLWRFHRIHHSSEALDWLAGSRLHLVDVVVTRALSFVPVYVLGFAPPAVYAYLLFVSFHAVFIHANVRFRLRALDWLVVTPRFHHWHHAADREAVDRNFAVHLPVIDRVLGTAYLPADRWPTAYGLQDERETWLCEPQDVAGLGPRRPRRAIDDGWWRQLVLPFRPAAGRAARGR